ncbi:MAG: hypothetical protein JJ896_14075 [Rhodothermales bacterium]|nr:hypothetical protein [Rhodothermales bacterium]MBO6780776.1 hypothetical protein [Rhodothermales bacterium]
MTQQKQMSRWDRFWRGEWTPENIERMERRIERGRLHFIVWVGMVAWGGTMGVITVAWDLWRQRTWRLELGTWPPSVTEVLGDLSVSLAIWPIGGVLFGYLMWETSLASYRKYQKELPTGQDGR